MTYKGPNLRKQTDLGASNVRAGMQLKRHSKSVINEETKPFLNVEQIPHLDLEAHVVPAPQLWDPVREAQALLEGLGPPEMAS